MIVIFLVVMILALVLVLIFNDVSIGATFNSKYSSSQMFQTTTTITTTTVTVVRAANTQNQPMETTTTESSSLSSSSSSSSSWTKEEEPPLLVSFGSSIIPPPPTPSPPTTPNRTTTNLTVVTSKIESRTKEEQEAGGDDETSTTSSRSRSRNEVKPTQPTTTFAKTMTIRDAIVVTVSYVDECVALRLKQLVKSIQSQHSIVHRDVWVLHNHYMFDKRFQNGKNRTFLQQFYVQDGKGLVLDDDDGGGGGGSGGGGGGGIHNNVTLQSNGDRRLIESKRWIQSITNLKSGYQTPSLMRIPYGFDTEKSGASKSSFLRLLNMFGDDDDGDDDDNNKDYHYRRGWLIEPDVFYTGSWGTLLDELDYDNHRHHFPTPVTATGTGTTSDDDDKNITTTTTTLTTSSSSTVDVLSVIRTYQNATDWWQWKMGYISNVRNQDIEPTQTVWVMIRVTSAFAKRMLYDLTHRGRDGYNDTKTNNILPYATGHHEGVTGAYARSRNFTVAAIPTNHLAYFVPGEKENKRKEDTTTLEDHGPVQRGKLYHPVKCKAYDFRNISIENDLTNWTH